MFDLFGKIKKQNKKTSRVTFFIVFLTILMGLCFVPNTEVKAQLFIPPAVIPAATAATSQSLGSVGNSFLSAFIEGFNVVLAEIAEIFLQLTAWLLWAAAEMLHYVIEVSILNIGPFVNSTGVLAAWQVFRDMANMAFIFIILYIAIGTILGLGGIDMKKMLVRIVIVALLLNFSFFFTKVAIDASNILTIGFYNQVMQTRCGPDGTTTTNIGSVFACKLGLTSFFSSDLISKIAQSGSTQKIFVVGVIGSLFFIIAAFAFLAATIMLLVRYITLIFLLMLSPLAFAAMALPNDKWSDKWKEKLFKQCVFAPALMAMIWATLQVLNYVATNSAATLSQAVAGTELGKAAAGSGEVLLNFSIVIAMIIGSLLVANEFGAYGAKSAIEKLKGAQKWTQDKIKATRQGAQGYVGRQTVGRLGSWADKTLGESDSRIGRFANTTFGRELRSSTTGALAKAKFGSKTNFEKYQKDKDAADKKYAEVVLKKRQTRAKFTQSQLEQRKKDTQEALELVRKDRVNTRQEELERNLEGYNKELADLNSEQSSDTELLSRTTNSAGYAAINTRVNDRAIKIKNLENKINSGPEATELKEIKEATRNLVGTLEDEARVAAQALERFKTFNEEEASKLFETTSKDREAREEGQKIGLTGEELEEFVKIERQKFLAQVKKLFNDNKTKNEAPVRVQLMRDAGSYGNTQLNITIKKYLREGKGGKKTKDIIEDLMKAEGIEGKKDEGGDKGDDKDKEKKDK